MRKVNLTIGHGGAAPLNGYLNVDPQSEQSDDYYKCDLHELTPVLDDGEAGEILALSCLEFYSMDEIHIVLRHWLKKLAIGGVLTIQFNEARVLFKSLLNESLSIEDFNDAVMKNKRSLLSTDWVVSLLLALGYKILNKKLYGGLVTICSIREVT